MTATPDNFLKSMMNSDRAHREVKVNISDVQESGLLKKHLRVDTVEEGQKAIHTMLESGIPTYSRPRRCGKRPAMPVATPW